MRQLAVVLALVTALGVVAIDRSGGRSTASVQALRHYYALGRRECGPEATPLPPTPLGNIQWQGGVTFAQFSLSRRGIPKHDQAALNAGCQSRTGG